MKYLKNEQDLVKFDKNFELKNISFRYKDGNQNTFENFNFKIEKGKYCLSGKSDLVKQL